MVINPDIGGPGESVAKNKRSGPSAGGSSLTCDFVFLSLMCCSKFFAEGCSGVGYYC